MTQPATSAVGGAQKVVAALLAQIENGTLRPGDQMPTIAALAQEYGVNKNTASKAVVSLKAKGVLSGPAGGNTWVRVSPPHKRRRNTRYHAEKSAVRLPECERSVAGVSEADSGIPLQDLDEDRADYAVIEAPREIREALALPPGTRVLRRTYTRRHAQKAGAGRSVSYLPYDLVSGNPDLLDPTREPWPGGTMHQLYTIGVELDRIVDRVTAGMPTPEEMRVFDIPPGVPLIRIRKVSYSTEGKPVEVTEIPLPADRIELIYTTQLERWS
ncbi:GntR family transcriptional regulator [Streptomyces sp. NPDC048516]|uniref:GntR family transcriptional regulator n=1 Tax=Streptomyces sp. NPDC048516 TaxID=3365565 RepID=UPI003721858C